jgi:hypothetical protein
MGEREYGLVVGRFEDKRHLKDLGIECRNVKKGYNFLDILFQVRDNCGRMST